MKRCSKCKKIKELSEFGKKSKSSDGYQCQCRACKTLYYHENRERILKHNKKYRTENHKKILEQRHQYRENYKTKERIEKYRDANREKIRKQNREYHDVHRDKILEQHRQYNYENREKMKKHAKIWRDKNRAHIKKRRHENRYSEHTFKVDLNRYMRDYLTYSEHKQQRLTSQIIFAATKLGYLVRPDACTECGCKKFKIQAHHWDYSKPLEVVWLCPPCHNKKHFIYLSREELKMRNSVRAKMSRAIRNGTLINPGICEECKSTRLVQGHHPDYLKPLCIEWLCSKCHAGRHPKYVSRFELLERAN